MLSSTRLFVGNLPAKTDENELYSAFSKYGEISTLDVKSKPATGDECKKFAFISLSGSLADIESCIKHFTNEDFNGHRLYVTRARESFLERLQKEREQTQKKTVEKVDHHESERNPVIKLGDKLNPKKRKNDNDINHRPKKHIKEKREMRAPSPCGDIGSTNILNSITGAEKKKIEADKKRIESILKKRQEFKEKKMIIKTGLTGIDKAQNKKVIFSDDLDDDLPNSEFKVSHQNEVAQKNRTELFDDDAEEDNDDVNFEIKKQFEGKKGQKVLDLQSRYKSDKRFTLDERFIDDEDEEKDEKQSDNEEVEIGPADEKAKQLDILQNVLGITIKSRIPESEKKNKSKPGMLRFDPMLPDHSKFLVPVETKPVVSKKSKKKSRDKQEQINAEPETDVSKVEVSKEQFYKVSDTLKEAIAQPTAFSLRSLFGNNVEDDNDRQEQNGDYIPLDTQKEKKKVKNPLEPTEKNPFVYDSSDSETEEPEKEKPTKEKPVQLPTTEIKAVWKENLFFSKSDPRLNDGLAFFSKVPGNEIQKDRRELKSLVKKRIYNKDRKNQMFKKKIGGRKKCMKKPYKNKN